MNDRLQNTRPGVWAIGEVAGRSQFTRISVDDSPAAFAELHATYSRRLYKTIITITRNPQDAEDALQDTFLRAYLRLQSFEGRASIYSWLTRIAINSSLMILRRRRVGSEVSFDPQLDNRPETILFELRDSAPSPEEHCERHQLKLMLIRAIHGLDPHLRRPIQMQMKGWTIREIGRALNISAAAVKTRLRRARLRLAVRHVDLVRSAAHR